MQVNNLFRVDSFLKYNIKDVQKISKKVFHFFFKRHGTFLWIFMKESM